MADPISKSDPVEALLSEVRGDTQAFDAERWSSWSETLGEWVEAYPAFGAGRLLRAKASRDGRNLKAADHLVEAAVFATVPGRLFDLLFRAGIESEIATFARAVEALEPEFEEGSFALDPKTVVQPPVEGSRPETAGAGRRGRWQRPDADNQRRTSRRGGGRAVEPSRGGGAPEGSLAREVVLGAIERSIEQEIEAVRAAAEAPPLRKRPSSQRFRGEAGSEAKGAGGGCGQSVAPGAVGV